MVDEVKRTRWSAASEFKYEPKPQEKKEENQLPGALSGKKDETAPRYEKVVTAGATAETLKTGGYEFAGVGGKLASNKDTQTIDKNAEVSLFVGKSDKHVKGTAFALNGKMDLYTFENTPAAINVETNIIATPSGKTDLRGVRRGDAVDRDENGNRIVIPGAGKYENYNNNKKKFNVAGNLSLNYAYNVEAGKNTRLRFAVGPTAVYAPTIEEKALTDEQAANAKKNTLGEQKLKNDIAFGAQATVALKHKFKNEASIEAQISAAKTTGKNGSGDIKNNYRAEIAANFPVWKKGRMSVEEAAVKVQNRRDELQARINKKYGR